MDDSVSKQYTRITVARETQRACDIHTLVEHDPRITENRSSYGDSSQDSERVVFSFLSCMEYYYVDRFHPILYCTYIASYPLHTTLYHIYCPHMILTFTHHSFHSPYSLTYAYPLI